MYSKSLLNSTHTHTHTPARPGLKSPSHNTSHKFNINNNCLNNAVTAVTIKTHLCILYIHYYKLMLSYLYGSYKKVTQEYNEMKGITTWYRLQYRVKLVPHQRVTQKGFKSTLLLHPSLTSHH